MLSAPLERQDANLDLREKVANAVEPASWLVSEDGLSPEEMADRRRRRRLRWGVGVLIVLLLGGAWFAARPVSRMARAFQARRLAAQAEVLLPGADWAAAFPLARSAVQLSFAEPAAVRAMAKFQSRAGSPEAIGWWSRYCEMQPDDAAALLSFAHAAIRHGELTVAEAVIQRIPAAERTKAAYSEVLSAQALARGDARGLEDATRQWVARAPGDELAALNLAGIELRSSDEALVAAARARLTALAGKPAFARPALRTLAIDALARRNFSEAARLAGELAGRDPAEFDDILLELDVLSAASDASLVPRLRAAQKTAGDDAGRIVALGSWMFTREHGTDTLRWLKSLPDSLRVRPPVAITVADALLVARDWNALAATTRTQDWRGSDFLRFAYQARAARELGRDDGSKIFWRRSLEVARSVFARATLVKLLASWKWNAELEETLWTVFADSPKERWVLPVLEKFYVSSGNTRGLNRVARERRALGDADPMTLNDLAATSLLLVENLGQAHRLAEDLAKAHPADAMIQSTYAYSLHLLGRSDEALAVLRKLPEAERRRPAVAAYYGICLVANGQPQLAEESFALAEASRLLPEERKAIREARSQAR